MSRISLRLIVLVCVASFALSCSDASGGGGPVNSVDGGGTPSLAVDACDKARMALAAVESEGLSNRVYGLVEDFLAAARSAGPEDASLLYQAMQVGDAHRGSNPELTLGPSLQNMVRFCDQSGY